MVLDQFKVGKITLDLDSTVITRYGDQEGSVVGYNPKREEESLTIHLWHLLIKLKW